MSASCRPLGPVSIAWMIFYLAAACLGSGEAADGLPLASPSEVGMDAARLGDSRGCSPSLRSIRSPER